MPLSINAIFDIPTREEKFTEKRDKELAKQRRDFYSYLDRLEREKEDYAYNTGLNRARSDLETGFGMSPDEAGRAVAAAAASGLLGNLDKAKSTYGGLPTAASRGEAAAGLELEKSKAGKQQAANTGVLAQAAAPYMVNLGQSLAEGDVAAAKAGLAKSQLELATTEGKMPGASRREIQRGLVEEGKLRNDLAAMEDENIQAQVRRPYLGDLAHKDIRLKLGNLDVGLKKSENDRAQQDFESMHNPERIQLQWEADKSRLQGQPVLMNQAIAAGNRAAIAGDIGNKISGMQLSDLDRRNSAAESVLQRIPDVLETSLIEPYEVGRANIVKAQKERGYLEKMSDQDIKRMMRITKPEDVVDWRGAGTVGPANTGKPSLKDILDQIELNK